MLGNYFHSVVISNFSIHGTYKYNIIIMATLRLMWVQGLCSASKFDLNCLLGFVQP